MNQETLRWIDTQKPELVAWAEHFLDQHPIYKSPHIVKAHQLRNLLNAARGGSPLAVMMNFLRYQLSRKDSWSHRPSGEELVRILGHDLKNLCAAGATGLSVEESFRLESQMTAQLVGFIIREYKYRKKINKPANSQRGSRS